MSWKCNRRIRSQGMHEKPQRFFLIPPVQLECRCCVPATVPVDKLRCSALFCWLCRAAAKPASQAWAVTLASYLWHSRHKHTRQAECCLVHPRPRAAGTAHPPPRCRRCSAARDQDPAPLHAPPHHPTLRGGGDAQRHLRCHGVCQGGGRLCMCAVFLRPVDRLAVVGARVKRLF